MNYIITLYFITQRQIIRRLLLPQIVYYMLICLQMSRADVHIHGLRILNNNFNHVHLKSIIIFLSFYSHLYLSIIL